MERRDDWRKVAIYRSSQVVRKVSEIFVLLLSHCLWWEKHENIVLVYMIMCLFRKIRVISRDQLLVLQNLFAWDYCTWSLILTILPLLLELCSLYYIFLIHQLTLENHISMFACPEAWFSSKYSLCCCSTNVGYLSGEGWWFDLSCLQVEFVHSIIYV